MEKKENKHSRHEGLEFLRIVAMAMIVALHIAVNTFQSQGFSINALLQRIIALLCLGGVNCYAFLSGWGGIISTPRFSRILSLWLQCLFYSVGICLLFYFLGFEVTKSDLMGSLHPITSDYWWYITAYFGGYPVMSVLGIGIRSLTIIQLKRIFLVIIITIVVVPAIFGSQTIYGLTKGYSSLWLILCYIIGGIIHRLYKEKMLYIQKSLSFGLCIMCILLFVILRYYERTSLPLNNLARPCSVSLFHYYNSPGILLISMIVFVSFVNLKIKSEKVRQLILKIAPLSLGTYLITVHPLIWKRFIHWHINIQNLNIVAFFINFVGLLIGILTTTFIIESIRLLIFKILHIHEMCNYITTIWRRQSVDRYNKCV